MRSHNQEREAAVLQSIKDFQATTGLSPSLREISEATGIPSHSQVRDYLANLEQAGKITRARLNGRVVTRQIEVVDDEPF